MNITAQIIKRMANQERWSAKLSSRIFRYSALRRAQEQGQICGFRVFVCNQQLGLWGWLCQGIAQNSMELHRIPWNSLQSLGVRHSLLAWTAGTWTCCREHSGTGAPSELHGKSHFSPQVKAANKSNGKSYFSPQVKM